MQIIKWIKQLLGLDAEVAQAVAKEREVITAKADSERKTAVQQVTKEKDAVIKHLSEEKEAAEKRYTEEKEAAEKRYAETEKRHAEELEALRKQMADVTSKDAKKYAELKARVEKFKKKEEDAAGLTKRGRGRPGKDRVPFNLYLDRWIKAYIPQLEGIGLLKRGEVTNHINTDLCDWLSPKIEVYDSIYDCMSGKNEDSVDSDGSHVTDPTTSLIDSRQLC